MNGAAAVLAALAREDVGTIFGYPGGAVMPLYDALHGDAIRHVLVRHEAAAVFAASGFARSGGGVGVCVATSGPGATNLVTGLLDAAMDSVPLVAITGQVRTALMGTDGFQEADVCAITQCATKRNVLVRDASAIPAAIAEAFAVARSGRPGPVLVDIPTDVLKAEMPADAPVPPRRTLPPPVADPDAIAAAAALIREAHRPVLIVGGGVRRGDATTSYRRLAALIGAPHVATINALGAAEQFDLRYLGMLGMHGTKAANLAVHRADLVVALGMRFDDRVTGRPDRFARGAKVIHADIDRTEFGKIVGADVSLHGDLAATLDALTAALAEPRPPRFDDWALEAALAAAPLSVDRAAPGAISATSLLDGLFAMLPPGAVVTTDVGQHQMWAAQRVQPAHPRDMLTSAGLGAMGFGVPAAIGAAFARPGTPVFAIVGDGGFQMSLAELATMRRHDLDVRIVVVDNQRLGMVRQWQELFYDRRECATDLSDNPDFAAIARAYGVRGTGSTDPSALDADLAAFVAAPGPSLLHVHCHPGENVWPIIPAGTSVDEMREAPAT